jgi:CBS domain-containing protein
MLVRDVMSSPAVTITPTDAVAEAARVLDRLSLTSLPVVDQERRLLGMIGEADVIGQLTRRDARGLVAARGEVPCVRDAMSRTVLTADADDDLAEVIGRMHTSSAKSLPVLLHDRVVGMISRRDVVRVLADGGLDAPADEFAQA